MATYEIKRCIFDGDWSQVFLARDTRTGKDVVLKQLREFYPGAESLARFYREFEITRSAAGLVGRSVYEPGKNQEECGGISIPTVGSF